MGVRLKGGILGSALRYLLFRLYYKKKYERLPAMLISFHYILHIFDSIIDCGPCWNSWQYPIERLCGMLLPLMHSKLYPYKNLANNVILAEKFNIIHLVLKIILIIKFFH